MLFGFQHGCNIEQSALCAESLDNNITGVLRRDTYFVAFGNQNNTLNYYYSLCNNWKRSFYIYRVNKAKA